MYSEFKISYCMLCRRVQIGCCRRVQILHFLCRFKIRRNLNCLNDLLKQTATIFLQRMPNMKSMLKQGFLTIWVVFSLFWFFWPVQTRN